MKTNKQYSAFDSAMGAILRADPKAVKAAMEAEKKANDEKRKAKRKPSTLGHVSSDKD
jgi:hypothetical protein